MCIQLRESCGLKGNIIFSVIFLRDSMDAFLESSDPLTSRAAYNNNGLMTLRWRNIIYERLFYRGPCSPNFRARKTAFFLFFFEKRALQL